MMDELKKEREAQRKELDEKWQREEELRLKGLQTDIAMKWTSGFENEEDLER